jgi:hypothetical protein
MFGRITTIYVLFTMTDNLCFTRCCMSAWITTIFALFFMTDNLCITSVVCLVGLRLFLYCFLLLLIYASLMLYVWSDYDYFCTVLYE